MKTFRYGANFKIIGKCDPQKLSYAGAFRPVEGTLQTLADHINKGFPWMPALLDGNRKRLQENANYAEVIAADIDGGMTLDEAIAHPFISAYCGLLIESASSKPEHNKFRIVFRLPHPVKGWETVRICYRYLIQLLGVADPACKDAHRYFFGAPGRVPVLLNESAVLPESFVEDAIAWHEAEEAKERQRAELARQQWEEWRRLNPNAGSEVAEALRFIPPYTPGENRYSDLIAMIGGVLSELGSEGEALLREWDGGRGEWGQGGFDRILRSLSKSRTTRKATLGTLFYLAKQGGYQFPQRDRSAELKSALAALRNEPDPEQGLAEVQDQERQVNAIQRFCDRLQRKANRFKQKVDTALYGAAAKDFYTPGMLVPDKSNHVVYRDTDELVQLLKEAHSKGFKNVHEVSPPGTSKSHTYGNLNYEFIFPELAARGDDDEDGGVPFKVLWLNNNAENPTVAPVENRFDRLVVRNAGMVEDSTRQTPSGKPYRHHPKDGQIPTDAGNCHRAREFAIAAAKGYASASETAASNPICQSCRFGRGGEDNPFSCKTASGDGYGFRHERAETLKFKTYIRAHGAQLPANFNYSNSIFILDEAEGQLGGHNTRIVPKDDMTWAWLELESLNPDAYQQLAPWRLGVMELYSGLSEVHYGWDDAAIHQRLPEAPENCVELIEAVAATEAKLETLLQNGKLESAPVQGLSLFLKVLWGREIGVLRMEPTGAIVIKTENPHLNQRLDRGAMVFTLDSTLSREKLAMLRHIDPNDILVIERYTPPAKNLKVKHIHGFGLLGTQRSADLDVRLDVGLTALKQKHSDLVVIDRLNQKFKTGADGHWFSDHTRGSNSYAGKSAIALVGLPLPNLGAIADLHLLHKKICEAEGVPVLEFDQFYKQAVDGELVQAVGRLRANRRPDEELTVYILGDTEQSRSLDYSLPACLNAELIDAEDITPDAADPARRAFLAVQQFMGEFFQQFGKIPTQQQVAEKIGKTQGYISKLAAMFTGGWKALLAVVRSLVSPAPEPLPATVPERYAATDYIPAILRDYQAGSVDIAAELATMIQTFGWRGWRRIVGVMSKSLRFDLLTALLLPQQTTTIEPRIGNAVVFKNQSWLVSNVLPDGETLLLQHPNLPEVATARPEFVRVLEAAA